MPQPSTVQLIDSIGRAIGRQRKEIDNRFAAFEAHISSSTTIDKTLNLVRRGLDAILEEAKQDGLTAREYCERRYQKPLDRVIAEYHFIRTLSFQVEVKRTDGEVVIADRKVSQPDKLRSMLMQSVERIVGEPVIRGRMLRGRIDPTRIAALFRGDPHAVLETSSSHLFLLGKAEKIRSFAEGLNDQPLGDPRALWFRSLLDQAAALGADTERIRSLTKQFHKVRETLEVAASEWEKCAELYGRTIHRQVQIALTAKSDEHLPQCTDIHRSYFEEFAEGYDANQPYRFRYLGAVDHGV